MNAKILILALCSLSLALSTSADPAAQQEGQVEIEKQRLVRFPDDADDQLHRQNDDSSNKNSTANDKENEAKRILAEINKINQALGYVKKQREEQYRLPPILDSSQYLFPKPAYHPFHSQTHQIAGSNGETLLVPSIRAVKFENDENRYVEYNEPTHTKQHRANNKHNSHSNNNKNKSKKTNSNNKNNINEPEHYQQKLQLMTLNEYQDYLQQQQQNEQQSDTQFYYRPNQVYVPAPQPSHHHKQDSYKHQQREKLPTHFMLPVRLYKLNKEEYTKKFAPQEYRVKGYKIVGDIDNFYARNSKPKQSGNKPCNAHHTDHKSSSAKYHLFFLPREVALSDVARGKPAKTQAKHTALDSTSKSEEQTSTRDEKLKPHRGVQGNTKASNGTQSTRKRVSARPATPTTPSTTTSPASLTNTKITPPPIEVSISAATTASPTASEGNFNQNTNKINSFFNRPALGLVQMNDSSPNAIKTAFQNIFKFPFRPEAKPNLEPVPLQTPQKTFYSTQSVLAPSNFFQTQQQQQQQQQEHNQKKKKPSNTNIADDYKWDDDNSSNSAAEEDDNNASSPEQSEKQLFGHFHAQKQETQKEALRQGGIIIQRLKVRKGGIAIAGPGGVATAGSGGTAIVGPGGYALTHPRSLTIAGPGAKVIAIPPNIDLKDALQRTNLNARTFPREGKIVATGPTVYYSPGAPSAESTE